MSRQPLIAPMLGLVIALHGLGPGRMARAETPEPASVEGDPADLCERAIINGARRGGVPVEVLHAVALTETGKRQDGRLRAWAWARITSRRWPSPSRALRRGG